MKRAAEVLSEIPGDTLTGYTRKTAECLSAPSKCPDCGRPITIEYDPRIAVAFPALMGLDQMVVCNGCADFRTALREAEAIMLAILALVRKRALGLTAKTQIKAALQGDIDALNAEYRPMVDSAALRLIRILARRSGRPQVDHLNWATQFLNIWQTLTTYSGEELMRVNPDDPTWMKFKLLRRFFGIAVLHHGKPREAAPAPPRAAPRRADPVEEMPEP